MTNPEIRIGVLCFNADDFERYVRQDTDKVLALNKRLKLKSSPNRKVWSVISNGNLVLQYVRIEDIDSVRGWEFSQVDTAERFYQRNDAFDLETVARQRIRL